MKTVYYLYRGSPEVYENTFLMKSEDLDELTEIINKEAIKLFDDFKFGDKGYNLFIIAKNYNSYDSKKIYVLWQKEDNIYSLFDELFNYPVYELPDEFNKAFEEERKRQREIQRQKDIEGYKNDLDYYDYGFDVGLDFITDFEEENEL